MRVSSLVSGPAFLYLHPARRRVTLVVSSTRPGVG